MICHCFLCLTKVFCPYDQKEKLIGAGLLKVLEAMTGKASVKPLDSAIIRGNNMALWALLQNGPDPIFMPSNGHEMLEMSAWEVFISPRRVLEYLVPWLNRIVSAISLCFPFYPTIHKDSFFRFKWTWLKIDETHQTGLYMTLSAGCNLSCSRCCFRPLLFVNMEGPWVDYVVFDVSSCSLFSTLTAKRTQCLVEDDKKTIWIPSGLSFDRQASGVKGWQQLCKVQ